VNALSPSYERKKSIARGWRIVIDPAVALYRFGHDEVAVTRPRRHRSRSSLSRKGERGTEKARGDHESGGGRDDASVGEGERDLSSGDSWPSPFRGHRIDAAETRRDTHRWVLAVSPILFSCLPVFFHSDRAEERRDAITSRRGREREREREREEKADNDDRKSDDCDRESPVTTRSSSTFRSTHCTPCPPHPPVELRGHLTVTRRRLSFLSSRTSTINERDFSPRGTRRSLFRLAAIEARALALRLALQPR